VGVAKRPRGRNLPPESQLLHRCTLGDVGVMQARTKRSVSSVSWWQPASDRRASSGADTAHARSVMSLILHATRSRCVRFLQLSASGVATCSEPPREALDLGLPLLFHGTGDSPAGASSAAAAPGS
jgi:hypothetical protein